MGNLGIRSSVFRLGALLFAQVAYATEPAKTPVAVPAEPADLPAAAPAKPANAPVAAPEKVPVVKESSEESSEESDEGEAPSRFWASLVPLGGGHFVQNDTLRGAGFLVSEIALLIAMSTFSESVVEESSKNNDSADKIVTYQVSAGTGFLGLWGYEVGHLLPSMQQEAPTGVRRVSTVLSFAPLGAAQYKNGQPWKAALVGVSHAAALGSALSAKTTKMRDNSLLALSGLWALSVIDGLLFQPASGVAASTRLQVAPAILSGAVGTSRVIPGMQFALDF